MIGGFSLRVYMTVLMMVYLCCFHFFSKDNTHKIRKGYIRLFLICILFLFIALFYNGGLESFGLLNRCLAYYLVCIVAYFAVEKFVNKKEHFDIVVFVISCIALFDAVITILQYQNNPIGWGIGAAFSDIEEFASFMEEHQSFEGYSKQPGIFGHPVTNGFVLAVSSVLLLIGIQGKRSQESKWYQFLKSLYYICALLVSVMALFFLQQRAAFFLLLIFIVYHLIKIFSLNSNLLFFILGIIIVFLVLLNPIDIGLLDFGRFSSSDNSSRTTVWRIAFDVISQSPLFGDILQYNRLAGYSAHNVLIDSLVNSGLFGFMPVLVLYCKTILESLHIMLRTRDNYARVFSYSVLVSMAMGMFHNSSYMTGDVIIFIVLALMLKANALSPHKIIAK